MRTCWPQYLSAHSANILWEKAQDYQGRLGGEYGSGVPSWIGGYFFRLSENSSTIFVTGATTHELVQGTPSRSSFKSVRRLMTFGSGRVNGGSYIVTRPIKSTLPFRPFDPHNPTPTKPRKT